uniref:Putative secreted protein n=1 Tax=Ixodes ricinus TaxID=34613 RepID=A0A6B0U5P9_IXORI
MHFYAEHFSILLFFLLPLLGVVTVVSRVCSTNEPFIAIHCINFSSKVIVKPTKHTANSSLFTISVIFETNTSIDVPLLSKG